MPKYQLIKQVNVLVLFINYWLTDGHLEKLQQKNNLLDTFCNNYLAVFLLHCAWQPVSYEILHFCSSHIPSGNPTCLSVTNAGIKINSARGLHIRSSNCIAFIYHRCDAIITYFSSISSLHASREKPVTYMLITHIPIACVWT